MTLRRDESCDGGVKCTEMMLRQGTRGCTMCLVSCRGEDGDWFQNSVNSQAALEDGDDGKRKRVDPRPTAELFLCR